MAETVFADPYKRCRECGGWITGARDEAGKPLAVQPCGHTQGYDDVCPSWSPVDGCCCVEQLGRRTHDVPPGGVTRG